mmetsp:Transcript_16442/g.30552  ORF Transcript_16442/g.30552 Transcript_16442/m.30552 type:complete len:91 (-) Transcript_16442:7-279(-)
MQHRCRQMIFFLVMQLCNYSRRGKIVVDRKRHDSFVGDALIEKRRLSVKQGRRRQRARRKEFSARFFGLSFFKGTNSFEKWFCSFCLCCK